MPERTGFGEGENGFFGNRRRYRRRTKIMIGNAILNALRDRHYSFDGGIRFQCRRCGACCTGEPGTIYVSDNEIEEIARHLGMTVPEFIAQYAYPFRDGHSIKELPDGRCAFFRGDCAIYPVRPRQCRDYPFWEDMLRSEAAWACVLAECPGVGQGPLFSKERILQILSGEAGE